MTLPIGAGALRDATAINHYRSDIDAAFSMMFRRVEEEESWVKDLFRITSVKSAYLIAQTWLSTPLPGPLAIGAPLRTAGFGELTYQAYVKDYTTPFFTARIHDMNDSHAPVAIETAIQDGSKKLGVYRRFILPEMLTASASTYLHGDQSFANIFGGTGLFSDTHSYNGQTLDNNLTGSGTSAGNLIDDIWTVRRTFREMVDSEGRPYHTAEDVSNQRMTFVVPTGLEQAFAAALKSELLVPSGATAPASNYTRTVMGDMITMQVFSTLSDANDWFAFWMNMSSNERPFIHGVNDGPRLQSWTEATSDYSRQDMANGWRWIRRDAFGIGNPFCAIKVNN